MPVYIAVSGTLQCRVIAGAWHLVALKPLPTPDSHRVRSTAVDVVLNQPIAHLTPQEARRHYGDDVYAVFLRRLARKELSQYPIPIRLWR